MDRGTSTRRRFETRRRLLKGAAFSLTAFLPKAVFAHSLDIRSHYSPRNRKRPHRPETWYIVLHTTEGREKGSLNKVWKRGETHYFVTEAGRVYRIIDKSRIATHAGRSMWEGRSGIDKYSIGVEVVGYHNKDISDEQYAALRELVRQLQSLYKIPDSRVVTHSMVAYGRPNRFHPYNHRGRKRCGMIFARPDVRRRLALEDRPEEDPDVSAGRLKVADAELFQFLFSPATADVVTVAEGDAIITPGQTAWDIAREEYASSSTLYRFPNGEEIRGDEVRDWGRMPVGTRVILASSQEANEFEGFVTIQEGETARAIAGDLYDDRTTVYLFPSGLIRTGEELRRQEATRRLLESPPAGTKVLTGYIYGGHVSPGRLPSRIAGRKWNYPSTFYRFPDGRILTGDEIDPSRVPPRTLVLFQS